MYSISRKKFDVREENKNILKLSKSIKQQQAQSHQNNQQQAQSHQNTQQQTQSNQQQTITIPGTNIQIPTSVAAANGLLNATNLQNIKVEGAGNVVSHFVNGENHFFVLSIFLLLYSLFIILNVFLYIFFFIQI